MAEEKYRYRQSYKIRSSEVRPDGKARLQSICDLLQETAGDHALALNFDISQLMEQNMTWVLHRLHLQMDRFPEWRETITIETWPSSGDSLRAYRDFRILDEDEDEIGRSLSYWLMLNLDTRRPVRMPEEILSMAPSETTHVLEIQKERLPTPSGAGTSKTFSVRRGDLDLNRHVNNVKYIEWALEAIPGEERIREIDMEFHAECTYGDTIVSELIESEDDGWNRHVIRRRGDGKIAALAKTLSETEA